MVSWQSEAVAAMYRTWAAELNNPDRSRQEPRETNDHWGDLTAEPRSVDYRETDADGTRAMWVEPHGAAAGRVLLWAHGGGFVGGSLFTHRKLVGHLAKAAGLRALIATYPHTPEDAHPAQLDHCYRAYQWLIGQGIDACNIVVGGDSAGATLALGTQLLAREQGVALAAGVFLISPWVDMTVSNPSYQVNADKDAYFFQPVVQQLASMYLAGRTDPRDPIASPAFADLSGLPPLYIQVGGSETLLDDARDLHKQAEHAGVDARIDVFEDQQHTFQMAAGRAPEADDAVQRFAAWIRPVLALGDEPASAR